ncbi:PspA/IM30 family protein [Alicyclobacillus sp. SO9]|uniref:PspA/IM30 family protein n=1 Tax=Alicyclobacillus sp. SO9 TaxID=2665646 RepID=UPI0018E819AA|nr:PspA/IM30 family protein [Alicyclobacillus sp. SO9]QQE78205.1 PspA/IM30 family protein [Alicyclobacillus sp. SO9]
MSLFSRLKNVVGAKTNEKPREAENPERTLSLYIEQATERLREFHVQVSRIEARCISLEKDIRDSQTAAAKWHQQAKEAVQQNKEDEARKALEREHQEQEDANRLSSELSNTKAAAFQLNERYEKLAQKLEEAKEQRDALSRRDSLAQAEYSAAEAMKKLSQDNPLAEFETVQDNVERHEAQAQAAYSTLNSDLSYQLADLDKGESNKKVDDALSQLKEEISKDGQE